MTLNSMAGFLVLAGEIFHLHKKDISRLWIRSRNSDLCDDGRSDRHRLSAGI